MLKVKCNSVNMELTKLQIKPLSGLSDWPIWEQGQVHVIFHRMLVTVDGSIVVYGSRKLNGTLYKAQVQAVHSDVQVQVNATTDDGSILQLYPEKFGHQNRRHVQAVIKRES